MLCALAAGCATQGSTSPPPQAARTAAVPDAERAALERFAAALTLMKNQQTDAALQAFIALHRDHPQFGGPLANIGILYAKKRQPALALAHLQKAVEANPRNAIALCWLGSLQRGAGDLQKARDSYLKAIAAQPGFAPAHFNLAVLYDVDLKRPAEALAEYREYRALAAKENLIVEAWIHELDDAMAPTSVAQQGAP